MKWEKKCILEYLSEYIMVNCVNMKKKIFKFFFLGFIFCIRKIGYLKYYNVFFSDGGGSIYFR